MRTLIDNRKIKKVPEGFFGYIPQEKKKETDLDRIRPKVDNRIMYVSSKIERSRP